jgi:archaellum biogenesis ATPase FlaH
MNTLTPLNLSAHQWMEEMPSAPDPNWLWHGILAPGCITLLSSQWKTGKSTLVAILLAKMQSGQPLAGLAVRQGVGLVVSEEPQLLWMQRVQKLGLRKHLTLCRPFSGVPDREQWRQLLDHIANAHAEHGLSLLVIDPLVMFFPSHVESDATGAAQALAELRTLAERGLAVLVLHHPKKGDTKEGQAARGIGVLNAEVDIILEMTHFSSPSSDDRRRKVVAFSRFEETPRRLLLELNPEGMDYAALSPETATPHDATLRELIRTTGGPVTAAMLRQLWPDGMIRPDLTTLRRWLGQLVERGLITQAGSGRKNDPFRFEANSTVASQPDR